VWKKSVVATTQSKPAFEFRSVCDFDPESPTEWYRTELFLSFITCTSFYKYVPYLLPDTKPADAITPTNELGNIEECKIQQPSGQFYPWRGFAKDSQMQNYYSIYASPRPKMIIQVIPVTWAEIKGEVTLSHGLFPLQRSAAAVHWRNCCLGYLCSNPEVGVLI